MPFSFNAAQAIIAISQKYNVYGHLEQVSRICVYFHFQITQLVLQTCSKCPYTLLCENSMIAHSALVMKDTFAPRFASIQ